MGQLQGSCLCELRPAGHLSWALREGGQPRRDRGWGSHSYWCCDRGNRAHSTRAVETSQRVAFSVPKLTDGEGKEGRAGWKEQHVQMCERGHPGAVCAPRLGGADVLGAWDCWFRALNVTFW